MRWPCRSLSSITYFCALGRAHNGKDRFNWIEQNLNKWKALYWVESADSQGLSHLPLTAAVMLPEECGTPSKNFPKVFHHHQEGKTSLMLPALSQLTRRWQCRDKCQDIEELFLWWNWTVPTPRSCLWFFTLPPRCCKRQGRSQNASPHPLFPWCLPCGSPCTLKT